MNSDDVRQRILEAIVVLEEYTPKLNNVDQSLSNMNQLITRFFDSLKTEEERILNHHNDLNKKNDDLSKKTKFVYNLLLFIIVFSAGFLVSMKYSEKYFFSDHRLSLIHELESENLKIRKQYLDDIRMIESLRSNGCIIRNDLMIAPKSKVKFSGKSEDKKFVGVWLDK
jgi:hypothetical protein